MTHEGFQQNLIDYVAERLSAEESRQLEAHLATCEECADFVSDLRPLPQLIARHGDALFDEHPDPAELRRHRSGAAGAESDRLERHLAVCAPCRLQALPAAELPASNGTPEAAPFPRAERRAPRIVKAAAMMAAGLIVGVMLGYLMRQPVPSDLPVLDRRQPVPAQDGPIDPPVLDRQQPVPAQDGPIDLPVLNRMTRGAGRVTRIQVRAGQEAVVIAVPIDALDARPDDERLLLQVATPSGAPIYELEESAGGLRRRAGETFILTLLIDSPRLPHGSYEVVIRAPGDGGEPIVVFQFETVAVDRR